ncbi:MAG: hypothetical protein ACTS2F_06930 [Thainema sp.]
MGGHASHDGNSVKPNTNAEESLDTAADLGVNPDEIVPPKGEDEVRSRRAPENKKATKEASKQ